LLPHQSIQAAEEALMEVIRAAIRARN
jgi:hypothetical protein